MNVAMGGMTMDGILVWVCIVILMYAFSRKNKGKKKKQNNPQKKKQNRAQKGKQAAPYGMPQNRPVQRPKDAKRQDILSRASAHAAEDFSKNTYEKEKAHEREKPIGMPDDCDLMKEVQDLIVMGYQGKMPYQRDFIGEAEEMLNRYLA